jgi:hypothetical protein
MTVELKPETERLVQEEICSGHVHSVDELIVYGVYALREKSAKGAQTAVPPRSPCRNLADFLGESPSAASEIDRERQELSSMELGSNTFFANPSIGELAAAQNVKTLRSAAELATSIEEETEDLDLMLETIYSSRK